MSIAIARSVGHLYPTTVKNSEKCLPNLHGKLDTRCKYSRNAARVYNAFLTHEQARELLAPVYGWFTEGFDTRDLKEAKALLDVLT